jgi:hypothetical protein
MYLVFIFLAGFVNSFMDIITFNEKGSIFHKRNWSPFKTYNPKKKFLGIVQFDPWHVAKYIMLGSLFTSTYIYSPVTDNYVIEITISFCCWWAGFVYGWDLFKRKLIK